MVTTRKENATKCVAQPLLDSKRKRRTKAEIEADKQRLVEGAPEGRRRTSSWDERIAGIQNRQALEDIKAKIAAKPRPRPRQVRPASKGQPSMHLDQMDGSPTNDSMEANISAGVPAIVDVGGKGRKRTTGCSSCRSRRHALLKASPNKAPSVDDRTSGECSTRKVKYNNSHLPQGATTDNKWRGTLIPTYAKWNGMLNICWGTKSSFEVEVLQLLWDVIYKHKVPASVQSDDPIHTVATQEIVEWRGGFASASISMIYSLINSNERWYYLVIASSILLLTFDYQDASVTKPGNLSIPTTPPPPPPVQSRRDVGQKNRHVAPSLGVSLAIHGDTPPFADHQDLYTTIDATPLGDVPWSSHSISYMGDRTGDIPPWMDASYEFHFRDPHNSSKTSSRTRISRMNLIIPHIVNGRNVPMERTAVAGMISCQRIGPGIKRIYCSRSGDTRFNLCANNPRQRQNHSLCCDGTERLLSPLLICWERPQQCPSRHRNAVVLVGFLPLLKLFHSSLSKILETLKPAMTLPEVTMCADGHYRKVIYGLGPYIADYEEQVVLAGIVRNWCGR
ncbi:hypothetical protein BU15DRAFT_59594, partial [Melanogaster broomeanus]